MLHCGVGLHFTQPSAPTVRTSDQVKLLSIANRTSSADVRTPSFWRMIEDVFAIVL